MRIELATRPLLLDIQLQRLQYATGLDRSAATEKARERAVQFAGVDANTGPREFGFEFGVRHIHACRAGC
ncbi:hypothetical protein GCM10027285_03370 [Oleiagrimonas citrea]